MRTKVPMPAKNSSPASVLPGRSPLASQAAASQASWTRIVAVMTCCRRSARTAALVPAHLAALVGDVVNQCVERRGVRRRQDRGRRGHSLGVARRWDRSTARDGHVVLPSPSGPAPGPGLDLLPDRAQA